MRRTLFLIGALLAFGGCHTQGQSASDPFFGRQTVPPPPTGSVGARPGDPYYSQQQLPGQTPQGGMQRSIVQSPPGGQAPPATPGAVAGPAPTGGAGWGLTPITPNTMSAPPQSPIGAAASSPPPSGLAAPASPAPTGYPPSPYTVPASTGPLPGGGRMPAGGPPTGGVPAGGTPTGGAPAGLNYRGASATGWGTGTAPGPSAAAAPAASVASAAAGPAAPQPSIIRIPSNEDSPKVATDPPIATLADRKPIVRTLDPRPKDASGPPVDGGQPAPRDIMDLPPAASSAPPAANP